MLRRQLFHLGLVAVLAPKIVAAAEPKVLFEKQSPYNTVVVTEDEQGLRTLMFERGGARQSVVKPGDPDHIELAYARVMPVGLALVKALTELHGGWVEMESEPGHGAVFTCHLPETNHAGAAGQTELGF